LFFLFLSFFVFVFKFNFCCFRFSHFLVYFVLSVTCVSMIPFLFAYFGLLFFFKGAPVAFSMFAEFLPTKKRGYYLVVFEYFWTAGTLLEAGMAWYLLCYLLIEFHGFVCQCCNINKHSVKHTTKNRKPTRRSITSFHFFGWNTAILSNLTNAA